MKHLLNNAAQRGIHYRQTLENRAVIPDPQAVERLSELDEPLPEQPTDPQTVIQMLDEIGSPATMASAGGRFFGFVVGSSMPVTLAANWLAGAWDQEAGMEIGSPISAMLEGVCLKWLVDIFGLPLVTGGGFVTGATMANFCGLAAARHALLEKQGWDVEAQGLFDAPPLTVVVSDEVHVSVLKALGMLGMGRERVTRVPTDGQGKMRADALPKLDDMTIVCLQAGNVNTSAFDPAKEICQAAHQNGAWVHVDGAFGLWAAASPKRAHLIGGFSKADSWATDAHKWLNVPYDSGLILVRDPKQLRAAMISNAAYLIKDASRQPDEYVPEMSRRARGVEIWAALRSLGRQGLADMIERCCLLASRFAQGLEAAGYEVLNQVILNQVLVSFGDDDTTRRVIKGIQEEGTCWYSGTTWHEKAAMRISVSSYATTEADVDRSLEAILRMAK